MTDDLVKRLRQSSSSDYSCQGCMDTEREEAADRIEKLEAALQRANATAEEYERKFYLGTDRIEKLEMLLQGEKCLRQDLKDTAEAHSKQQRDRIEKLETALREIKNLHHGPEGEDDLWLRDDITYRIVCEALEGK